ncbi:MAG: hypothetical protein ABI134_33055 [Byssovorax sp.]
MTSKGVHSSAESEGVNVKASGQCSKCGSKKIKVKNKQVWPLLLLGTLVVDLYICDVCGYVETYESNRKKVKREEGV